MSLAFPVELFVGGCRMKKGTEPTVFALEVTRIHLPSLSLELLTDGYNPMVRMIRTPAELGHRFGPGVIPPAAVKLYGVGTFPVEFADQTKRQSVACAVPVRGDADTRFTGIASMLIDLYGWNPRFSDDRVQRDLSPMNGQFSSALARLLVERSADVQAVHASFLPYLSNPYPLPKRS